MANNVKKNNKKKPGNNNSRNNNKKYNNNRPQQRKQEEAVKEITYSDSLTVGQLANLLHKNSSEIIKFLFMM